VAEPPARGLAELVAAAGPVRTADRVRRQEVPDRVRRETRARRADDRAEADLRATHRLGARLLTPEDPDWPALAFAAFRRIAMAAAQVPGTGRGSIADELVEPLALWVRGPGRLAELSDRAVAVVGARAATGYGAFVAEDFGYGLGAAGFTVVSGAALGIDGASHRGALAAEAPTIAVLAGGIDQTYPREHSGLLARIQRTGLLVSEYPPGTVPARHRFLVRNRLIAALGAGTVVVEASGRSGAQRTARDAAALGRPVLAVPGPITSAMSVGCHELLRDQHAVLVTRVEEVIEAVGRIGIDLAAPPPAAPARATDGLDAEALRVHDALPARASRSTYRISVESGVPIAAVRAALPELERRGLIERTEGSWRRVSKRPP
jgi:DNA processing protein